MSKVVELMPKDSHKSFYGKARVIVEDDGTETLISYSTAVVKRYPSGNLVRLWDGWSATTGRHIAAFCGLNKKGYSELPKAW